MALDPHCRGIAWRLQRTSSNSASTRHRRCHQEHPGRPRQETRLQRRAPGDPPHAVRRGVCRMPHRPRDPRARRRLRTTVTTRDHAARRRDAPLQAMPRKPHHGEAVRRHDVSGDDDRRVTRRPRPPSCSTHDPAPRVPSRQLPRLPRRPRRARGDPMPSPEPISMHAMPCSSVSALNIPPAQDVAIRHCAHPSTLIL